MDQDQYDEPVYQYEENMINQYYQEESDEEYDSYQNTNQGYQILPQPALLGQLMNLVKRAMELTKLTQGWCLILLNEFKWNIQYINDKYFDNSDLYKKRIGWKQQFEKRELIVKTKVDTCAVCCEQKQLLSSICGHSFCLSCWVEHITSNINLGTMFFNCMQCTTPLLYESIKMILQDNQVQNKKIITRYQKKLCELFTTINNSYQFCLGIDCNNCIKSDSSTLTSVKCICGKTFCFGCKADDHSPCSCEQKKIWIQLVLKQEADAKWISIHTKMCPWCKKNVERSAGCNFMACRCGKSFCYMCSKPWQPDHRDHFNCHIYKKKPDQIQNKEKEVLAKMNFFAQKYLNNNSIMTHLSKVQNFIRRKFLFETLGIELAQSQFIDQAYKFAIECCSSLKWIYAYSYFLDFQGNQQKKEQFQFSQGEFEKYKQQLLKRISYDLKQFIQGLEKKLEEKIPINIPLELQNFRILKKSIVNYYTSTKSFQGKFIQEIQNMEMKLAECKKKSSIKPQIKAQIKTQKIDQKKIEKLNSIDSNNGKKKNKKKKK